LNAAAQILFSLLEHCLFILKIFVIRGQLNLNDVVLNVPRLYLSYELFKFKDELMEVFLILQPIAMVLLLKEGILDADIISSLSLTDSTVGIFVKDPTLRYVIDCVSIYCLGHNVSEKPENKRFI
jgi:hypothetical protein